MINKLFGDLIAGIDNTEDWKRLAGIYYIRKGNYGSGTKSVLFTSSCKYPQSMRYYGLCKHAKSRSNRKFWSALAKCHKTRVEVRTH